MRHVSVGTPRARIASTNSRAPGSPSCSTSIARVPARVAQPRQEREQVRLRARDARDLLHVQDRRHRAASSTRVGPVLDRVVALDARAQLAADRGACFRPCGDQRADPLGERLRRRPAGTAATARCRRRARRSPGSRRAPAGTTQPASKTTLSSAPLRMLLTSTSAARVHAGDLAARRPAVLDRDARASSRYARSSSVSDGPRSSSSTPSRAAPPRRSCRGPFAGDVRPSASSRSGPSVLGDAGERVDVDAVPDRDHLRRRRAGTSARSTVSTRRRDALREPQQPRRAPVREPEQQRNAQRAHERRREHRVDRRHVREHRDRPRAQLRHERGGEPRTAQRLRRRADHLDAHVRRQDAVARGRASARRARRRARRARAASARSHRAPDRRGRRAA